MSDNKQPFDAFTFERIYNPVDEEAYALFATRRRTCTRKIMATIYAKCILASRGRGLEQGDGVNFTAINAAILARWPKGLLFIKKQAWKLLKRTLPPP